MTEPEIVCEGTSWALLSKPHGMPSAPLVDGEKGTLLEWFLGIRPETSLVIGRKPIEHGLLHRLDTGTAGLVLVAKTQEAYDALLVAQRNGLIKKTYFAFCNHIREGEKEPLVIPFTVRSRFRSFGPGGREVRPLFPGMRGYEKSGTDYETTAENIAFYTERNVLPVGTADKTIERPIAGITCSLVRGYRHQVRSHLAFLGYPIVGDPLYNSERPPYSLNGTVVPLQLYAPGISFSDPDSSLPVSFSLPIPDKMSL